MGDFVILNGLPKGVDVTTISDILWSIDKHQMDEKVAYSKFIANLFQLLKLPRNVEFCYIVIYTETKFWA